MALKIDAPKGEVKNLKYRKEGKKGADGAVPLDVKVSLVCSGAVLTTLLGSAAASFWRNGEGKPQMYPGLGKAECINKFKYVQLTIGTAELPDATISSIKFTCLDNKELDVEFNASVAHIPAKELEKLKGYLLGNAIPIKCDGGDLVDLMADDEEEDEEDDGQQDIED